MPATRRRFALCGAALLSGIAGRSGSDDAPRLRTVHLDLVNWTDRQQTLHFALEAEDGLGRWHEFDLGPTADREGTVEPASDRNWTGYHAIAGDERSSDRLPGRSDEYACLHLEFRIEDDVVALFPMPQFKYEADSHD